MDLRTKHLITTPWQDRYRWSPWRILWAALIVMSLGLILVYPATGQAKTFQCHTGDVPCLIAAITEANASGKKNEIRLEAGTYSLVDAYEQDPTSGSSNGLPSISGHLTIQGAGADLTVIERDLHAEGPFRLIRMTATGTLTLNGLTLRGGQFIWGGGIANYGGTLMIIDSVLTQNFDLAPGGGFGAGAIANSGTLTITDSSFADNDAFGHGGAIVNDGMLAITNSTFTRNVSLGDFNAYGGAISNSGTLTITHSTLIDNVATGNASGGAIGNSGTLTILNSTFAGNTALTGNLYGEGGAIRNHGMLTILNSTLARNTAQNGGDGLANSGTVYLHNTILGQNTVTGTGPDCTNAPAFSAPGTIISLGNNLVGDLAGCTIIGQGPNLTGDPGLGDFTDDDTPGNGHFPLLPTSQAINAGNPKACPKTDQLGEKRDKSCDIGAIEFQGMAVSSR